MKMAKQVKPDMQTLAHWFGEMDGKQERERETVVKNIWMDIRAVQSGVYKSECL